MSNGCTNDTYDKIRAACDALNGGQSKWKALAFINIFRSKCYDIATFAMGGKSKEQLIENERLYLLERLTELLDRQGRGLDK